MKKLIDEYADFTEQPLLTADGFDKAIIGICIRKGSEDCVAYDYDKCIKILEKDMTHQEAVEYMEYNVTGAYMGKYTPCFLMKLRD